MLESDLLWDLERKFADGKGANLDLDDSIFWQSLHVNTPGGGGGHPQGAGAAKDLENVDRHPPPFLPDIYALLTNAYTCYPWISPDSQAQSSSAARLARIHSVQASSTKPNQFGLCVPLAVGSRQLLGPRHIPLAAYRRRRSPATLSS